MKARWFSARVAILLSSLAATAHAGEDADEAQALFEEARALVLERRYAEACPKLAASLRLDRALGTMLWLADCYEKNGQTASGHAQFVAAAKLAAERRDPREKVATRRANDLEARLTRVTVVLPKPPVEGLVVRRDGVPVDEGELDVAVPIDPGVHTFSASAAGYVTWTAAIDFPSRPETIKVNVPVLLPAPAQPQHRTIVIPSATPPRPLVTTTPPPSGIGATRIAGISLFGAGVVAVGAGAFLGLRAKATYESSDEDGHCSPANECDAIGKARREDATSLATGSTIAFGVGAAALVAGAVLYFVGGRDATRGVAIAPVTGGRDAGVVVTGPF